MDNPNYYELADVFNRAYNQAADGKGKERHANTNEQFRRQIICEVARRVGVGYQLGQAVKKIYESQRLDSDAGVRELLGAINYIAAAVIIMEEQMNEWQCSKQEYDSKPWIDKGMPGVDG